MLLIRKELKKKKKDNILARSKSHDCSYDTVKQLDPKIAHPAPDGEGFQRT